MTMKSNRLRKRNLLKEKCKITNPEEEKPKPGRKSRKRKSTKNYYFSQEVQLYIEKFQITDEMEVKNEIYNKYISPAFNELVQSLISVYKFKATNEDINHLKSDCVAFLFETIYKWKPDKGKKAFSYFNVVAKNYLTIQSRKMIKNNNRSVFLDDQTSLSNADKSKVYEREYVDGDVALAKSYERYLKIVEVVEFITTKMTDSNDIKCCLAIKKLYDDIDDIEFFNKRAIFVYLREISGLNSSELSSSLSRIRKVFKKNVGHEKQFNIFDLEWFMKEADKLLSKVEVNEKKEDQLKNFADILDSIESLENKKKMLWKEIYENALEDREKAKLLFNDAYISMQGGVNEHMNIGSVMSKYMERMSKSNDQILKLAELIAKEEEKSEAVSEDDIFSKINS